MNAEPNENIDKQACATWQVRVDRLSALTRAIWRLVAASVPLGVAFAWRTMDWGLLWTSQPLTFVALGVVFLLLVATGMFFLATGLRWLLLAAWPSDLSMRIDPSGVGWSFGPFGSGKVPWNDLDARTEEGYEEDMLTQLPDDAFTPVVRDRRDGTDYYARLQSVTGVSPEKLNGGLRPYLRS